MHAPPSVAYPVGRPPAVACGLALLSLAGLVVCVAAAWSRREAGLAPGAWAFVSLTGASLALSVLAGLVWTRLLAGRLRWDGQTWVLDGPAAEGAEGLALQRLEVIDLMGSLLFRVRVTPHQTSGGAFARRAGERWIWARSSDAPELWHGLRCAALAEGISGDARRDPAEGLA